MAVHNGEADLEYTCHMTRYLEITLLTAGAANYCYRLIGWICVHQKKNAIDSTIVILPHTHIRQNSYIGVLHL